MEVKKIGKEKSGGKKKVGVKKGNPKKVVVKKSVGKKVGKNHNKEQILNMFKKSANHKCFKYCGQEYVQILWTRICSNIVDKNMFKYCLQDY